jgi:hypothetical protein
MKVTLGPYRDWIGPYQIADWLQKVGVSEDRCYKFGEWLSNTWVNAACTWVHSKKHRTIKVKIDRWDSWSADCTMSTIIAPLLKQLHETKHGAPCTDDEDVPEGLGLRSTECAPKENEWDTDENHFRRFDWILEEIIWAHTQLHSDTDWESQYHTGNIDIQFKTAENGMSEMINGPNDTHVFDHEGWKAHSTRIDNGLRLFGKYYRALWD